jgi:hypothetical protein
MTAVPVGASGFGTLSRTDGTACLDEAGGDEHRRRETPSKQDAHD